MDVCEQILLGELAEISRAEVRHKPFLHGSLRLLAVRRLQCRSVGNQPDYDADAEPIARKKRNYIDFRATSLTPVELSFLCFRLVLQELKELVDEFLDYAMLACGGEVIPPSAVMLVLSPVEVAVDKLTSELAAPSNEDAPALIDRLDPAWVSMGGRRQPGQEYELYWRSRPRNGPKRYNGYAAKIYAKRVWLLRAEIELDRMRCHAGSWDTTLFGVLWATAILVGAAADVGTGEAYGCFTGLIVAPWLIFLVVVIPATMIAESCHSDETQTHSASDRLIAGSYAEMARIEDKIEDRVLAYRKREDALRSVAQGSWRHSLGTNRLTRIHRRICKLSSEYDEAEHALLAQGAEPHRPWSVRAARRMCTQ